MELAPVIAALGSLSFFVCYFSYVLMRGIPRHWGVPYKDRLRRSLHSSAHGVTMEVLNAVFSIASCALFVMETYDFSLNYNFIVRSFSLELGFNGFFLCNFMLHLYLASHKLWHLVSLQAVVDIVTIPPSYAILLMNDGLRNSRGGLASAYLGLKVTRVIRVVRLLGAISYFGGGPSLAFDRSRQVLVLQSQLMRRGLQTLVMIFIMAGMTNFLVEVQNADWGTGYGHMPFHDALYYIVVSFSTVGYGDIAPSTPLSRLLISCLILSLFFCAPLVTNALVNLTRMTPKHGGSLSERMGTGHVVIGCDSSCLRVVSVLLGELLAPDSTAYHTGHIVIVVPQEPTLAWEALLCLQPSRAVTYLNGDLRSAKDLRRAQVGRARACFVLADRLAPDTEAQDKTALVRVLCVHQASPLGASVLCLVTHGESKRRLVRLGVPVTSVVCYQDVMERLVAHSCLHPGFSTIWANILSCMPEARHLLKAKRAEQAMQTDDRMTLVYEAEMEYLRSLQGVLIRFHLDAFSGECVGTVAIELHRECECTLIALIDTACSSDDKDEGQAGRASATVMSPNYGTIVRDDDVGVFIGANRLTADRLARYCAARRASAMAMEEGTQHSSWDNVLSFSRSQHSVKGAAVGPAWNPGDRKGGWKEEEERRRQAVLRNFSVKPRKAQGDAGEERRRSFPECLVPDTTIAQQMTATGGSVNCSPTWSVAHDDGQFTSAFMSPLNVEGLAGSHPGRIVVVAQSLSFALGVVLVLCEASSGRGGCGADAASTVTVLCPPAWWAAAVDEVAERALAARFPSVQVHKCVPEHRNLVVCGVDSADLVCIVSSGGSQKHESDSLDDCPSDNEGGDASGWGQGADGWAMGVIVDVLGLVTSSTRVVVRLDDTASAEQHQVINAHVRRRCAVQEQRRRLGRLRGRGKPRGGREEKFEEDRAALETRALGGLARGASGLWKKENNVNEGGSANHADAAEAEEDAHRPGTGEDKFYFDGARGVQDPVFEGCFATMSGYASGDVVVGIAAELLLLQTMMAEDMQFILQNVLQLSCRVPIETLWPRRRPRNFGEAYRSLLKNRRLLAVGLHRPPTTNRNHVDELNSKRWPGNPLLETRRETRTGAVPGEEQHAGQGGGSARTEGIAGSSAAEGQGCSRGESGFLAIACPRASFPLRAGDCLFVLRQPSEVTTSAVDGVGVASNIGKGGKPKGASRAATETGSGAAVEIDAEAPPVDVASRSDENVSGTGRTVDGNTQAKGQTAAKKPDGDDDDDATTAAEWALGLLVRSSPHRVTFDDHHRADLSSARRIGNDRQPLLRARVLDATKRAAVDHARRGAGNTAVRDPSAAPFCAVGERDSHADNNGRGRAPPQRNFKCAGCGLTLTGWEEGSDDINVPLALGCGHTVCLHCLEALEKEHLTIAEGRESSDPVSTSWLCPSCGESASAVLPLV